MLLPTLFLPFDLFGNQYIYLLLSKIRERLAEIQASRAGLPLILACSSRYRLNIYDNILPSLNYSRSDLENKSKEIVHILSAAETPLSRLNWNLIHDDLSRSDQIADVSRDSVFPLAISQKLCAAEFDEILNSLLQGKNLEIDPLQDSHSLFLCWNYNTSPESPGRYWVAIQRLLNIGIPLMWIQGAMPEPGQSSGPGTESTSLEEAAEHADTLLGWAHGEFHCRFYRYNCKRLAPGQQDEVGIRRYVRNGILFWEDHRFLPREMPEPPTKVPLL
jgi:hypothetical protein